jgi:signal transduction histidine kinase
MSSPISRFSHLDAAVYLLDADTLRCEYANVAAQRDLQYSMVELCELMPRDDAPGFSAESPWSMQSRLRTGEKREVGGKTYFRRKDGTVFPVVVRLHLWQGSGKSFLIVIANVISKHFTGEISGQVVQSIQGERLEGSGRTGRGEAYPQAVISNAPGMVFQYVLHEDGNHSMPFVSDQCVNLLDIAVKELQANPAMLLDLVLPGEDRESLRQSRAQSAASLTTWNWEGRLWIESYRDTKWVSLRASPRRQLGVGVIWEGIIINVTQSRRRETELKESHERLKEVSSHVMAAREHERIRIAREIHDDLGGNLTAIKIDLDWLARHVGAGSNDGSNDASEEGAALQAKIRTLSHMVDRTMHSIQRISRDLRPGIMDFGIVAAIEWESGEFAKRLGIPCEVTCPRQDINLEPDIAVAVFRIFQEALTNISKHAHASCVWVRLHATRKQLELEVRDNGCGIMLPDRMKIDSFGIRGMIERARLLDGKLTVASGQKQGTTVLLSIPLVPEPGDPVMGSVILLSKARRP